MKTQIKLMLPLILLSMLAFVISCDKIEEPYVKIIESVDTAACPIPEFPALTAATKRVLLEDYTGHTCVNCPSAAILAHNLKIANGDKLVLLAVHAGRFAEPASAGEFTYDFRSEAGTTWDNYFQVGALGNPKGMVDRIGYSQNTHVKLPALWGAAVNTALATEPLLDLQMINEYDSTERKLCTHIKTSFITSIDKNLKLIVVLTESGIVKPQKNNDANSGATPVIIDYVHNHVLRTAISTNWGSTIATTGTVNPESVINSYKYILKDEYVPENCSVVAFVYDDETKVVLQVVEVDVIQ